MLFANTKIVEQQQVASVKLPRLRIADSQRRVSKRNIDINLTKTFRKLSELIFKMLITSTIEGIQTELVTVAGQKLWFFGTEKLELTLKF